MAIDEGLINNGTSATTNPTAGNSIAIIQGGTGQVFLEVEKPTGVWNLIAGATTGAFIVVTPDTGLNYRFRASAVTETRNVYFGA